MKIVLVGEGPEITSLEEVVVTSLMSLGLKDIVEMEISNDPAYKMELGVTANPALCIEESTIDFKDMIFEGVIPEKAELISMFSSILGSPDEGEGGSCGTGGCGSCSSSGGCGSSTESNDSCSTGHCH